MEGMAETFKERNALYDDNYKVAGDMLKAMFPEGMPPDHEVGHLFSLIVVKMSRFSNSGMTHKDSIWDIGVYAAMICDILKKRELKQ